MKELKNRSKNPQAIEYYSFEGLDKSTCTLSVPKGSLELYKTAEGWKDFTNIVEFDNSGVETTNANDVRIAANGNEITVSGVDDAERVDVYSTNGTMIYSGNEKTVSVTTHGVYIVRVAGVTRKVVL